MQSATELTLPHLPIETDAFASDPTPFMVEARRQHPWLARCNVGYFVTDYQAIKDILYQDDKLRMPSDQIVSIMGAEDTGWGRFTKEMMLSRSGEDHARLRGAVAETFTPRNVNRFRPLMRSVVSELLDEWVPKASFDFADFAANFPIRVMCGLIGTSPDIIPSIRSALEVQGSSYSLDPSRMPEIEASFKLLWDFVDRLIVERGPNGGHDDLLDALIAANSSGALNDVELRHMLIFLFGAGYDTSKNQLTLIMYNMLNHPDMWEHCAEDRAYCDKVVEEALRHTSPSMAFRLVTEDIDYRGVRIPKGAMVIFPLSLSGRDQEVFSDPLVFNPDRVGVESRHMAFGRGMHICLGQFLARAQISEGLHLMAQRITKPKLAGKVTWRDYIGVWGIRNLPISFEPAPSRPEPEPKEIGASRGKHQASPNTPSNAAMR